MLNTRFMVGVCKKCNINTTTQNILHFHWNILIQAYERWSELFFKSVKQILYLWTSCLSKIFPCVFPEKKNWWDIDSLANLGIAQLKFESRYTKMTLINKFFLFFLVHWNRLSQQLKMLDPTWKIKNRSPLELFIKVIYIKANLKI